MRQFYLQNQYGERLELQGGAVFLWEPDGLGYQDDISYMATDGFFIETSREQGQVQKHGTLVFKRGAPYPVYREVVDWILAAESITLAYAPYGEWYYCDVNVESVEKSELTQFGVLEAPVVFTPLSPWYAPYDLNLVIEGEGSIGIKQYTYTYPYRYSNSAHAGVLEFTISAQIPSDFELTIPGPVQAPMVTATRLDTGEVIGRVDLSTTSAEEGENIIFSTRPMQAGARLVSSTGTTDLTAQLGLTAGVPTFFRLPPNVPVQFAVTATSLVGVNTAIRVYRYYRTV